jgi:hypothetical protein
MTIERTIGSAWHMSLAAIALGVGLGGCFVPPNFDPQPDGGGSSRPHIVRDGVTPKLGEDFTVKQSEVAFTITVQVRDADEQTISGRLFHELDFSKHIAEVKDTGGSNGLYALSFLVSDLCGNLVNSKPGEYLLSVVVTDGTFVNTGTDLSSLEPGSAGGRDQASWRYICSEV